MNIIHRAKHEVKRRSQANFIEALFVTIFINVCVFLATDMMHSFDGGTWLGFPLSILMVVAGWAMYSARDAYNAVTDD